MVEGWTSYFLIVALVLSGGHPLQKILQVERGKAACLVTFKDNKLDRIRQGAQSPGLQTELKKGSR